MSAIRQPVGTAGSAARWRSRTLALTQPAWRNVKQAAKEERKPPWRPRRLRGNILIAVLSLSGTAVLITTAASIIALAHRGSGGLLGLDDRCSNAAFSCGVAGGLLVSIVPIVVAVLTLLLWRLRSVRRRYLRRAREHPEELVETPLVDHVVGRNGLCEVIQGNVQNREDRVPHLLVGGVGVGKTAMLVRLTRLLAMRGAVPVPIRLREAQKNLDFLALARERFLSVTESWLLSETEGDKIWRKLREQDRIVVLADGLEEALIADDVERSRDTAIRLAFADARSSHLPLVVTSRPHDALRFVDAAILRLEPLSESAALRFIHGDRPDRDSKVKLIVEQAEVVEAPLYMQLSRALHARGLLAGLDTRHTHRLALRVHLLDSWREGMVDGQLFTGVPYASGERERALKDLEALACVGLVQDSLEVAFEDLALGAQPPLAPSDYRAVLADGCPDVRFGASVGARLDVVEAQSRGVRFRHSIVQAYLGSRSLTALLEHESCDYLHKVLANPGREALMSLVMFCFRDEAAPRRALVRDALRDRLSAVEGTKAVDMFATAVEIDSMIAAAPQAWIATQVKAIWKPSRDEATEESKLRAVARLGEAGRRGDASDDGGEPRARQQDIFRALWWICTQEDSYPVRLAAAQELASGRSIAFGALRGTFNDALDDARGTYCDEQRELEPGDRRRFSLQGWVLPPLAGSVGSQHRDDAIKLVGAWIELLCAHQTPLSIEASWAQGFKYEANRRPACAEPNMRVFLAEQAELLAGRARFWYSRVCLLQAFTLWQLRDGARDAAARENQNGAAPSRHARHAARGAARSTVDGWEIDCTHPFVTEAAALCRMALQSAEPARYIWIDEAGIVSKLGPKAARDGDVGNSRLWISPAAGWLGLDSRARRLVGEVIVLLNLAERPDPLTSEWRLERANGPLPPCLSQAGGREHMQVGGVEVAGGPRPGSTCRHGCRARLCPYPAPGQQPFRGEFNEAFSRDQRSLALRAAPWRRGRTAPWQSAQRAHELKDFWREMEARSRL